MTDNNAPKCYDCELVTDGWCCRFGVDIEDDDPVPEQCIEDGVTA
jgi:hypothetical protein